MISRGQMVRQTMRLTARRSRPACTGSLCPSKSGMHHASSRLVRSLQGQKGRSEGHLQLF